MFYLKNSTNISSINHVFLYIYVVTVWKRTAMSLAILH